MAKNARKQRVVAARKKKAAAAQRTPNKTPKSGGEEENGKRKIKGSRSRSKKRLSEENTSPTNGSVVEPLYVHQVTRLPLKSPDRESQTVWYACRKCLRVFGTAKERDTHRQLHKKQKKTLKSPSTPKRKSFKTPKSKSIPTPPLVSGRKSARKSSGSTEALADDVSSPSKTGPAETSISSTVSSQDVSSSSSSKHQTQGNELSCPVCNKKFTSRKDLKRHVAGHNATQPEKAIHLGRKTLFGKASILGGGGSSDDDAPYDLIDESTALNKFSTAHTCKVCNKTFAQKRNLTGHMETHKDVDRFSLSSPGASVKTNLRRATREGPRKTAKGLFQSAIRQKKQGRGDSPGPISP